MAEVEVIEVFLSKAEESLDGAESEFINRRYHNSVNRGYYACFQAAIVALAREGITPRGRQWGHDFVQAQFAGELVYRRKLYPPELRDVLPQNLAVRQRADYELQRVSEVQALRALRRARDFVAAIQERR